MKTKVLAMLFAALPFLTPQVVMAAEEEVSVSQTLGWLTLVPPLVAIVLAFVTKNVVLSLFIGIFSGTIILQFYYGLNILSALVVGFMEIVEYILTSLADPWNAGIVLQVLVIGGLIALITKSGGARAVAEALTKYAKGPISTQLVTWVLGLFIFFDDYANALIVGPIMRPVSDKMKMSRERLAFVVDATAAPVAGIALVSTWIGYEVGLINDAYEMIGQNVNAYSVFLQTIPYRFYMLLMLLFVVLSSATLREFGPMKKAQERARDKGLVLAEDSKAYTEDEENEFDGENGSIWNALIPIFTLIVASFAGFYTDGRAAVLGGDDAAAIEIVENSPVSFAAFRETFGASDASVVLFQAALIASIVALLIGVADEKFSLSEGIEHWISGMKTLLVTGVVLLLAWSLSAVMDDLGTADFLISLLGDSMPPVLLPTMVFLFGGIISFATGTSYGTMGILMPLAVPLAVAMQPDNPAFIYMSVGAVLSGAIFGDHSSPISDTTILSSMGAGSNLLDHVRTQLPYAVSIALVTILFGYIPAALGLNVWLTLILAVAAVFALVFLVGKKVDTTENHSK